MRQSTHLNTFKEHAVKPMSKETMSIDVTHLPDLLRLAEEVKLSKKPRLLRRDAEDLAILMPVAASGRTSDKRTTKADYEAFLSAAGSWKDVDVATFLANNATSRRISSRPPVKL